MGFFFFFCFAICFGLNASAVIDFYSQLGAFYKRFFWPTCLLVLFSSVRRTKGGQKSLVGQSAIFRQVFLPSWFCTVRGVTWHRQNPSLVPVPSSSSQPRWPAVSQSPVQQPPGRHTQGHDAPHNQAAPGTPLQNLATGSKATPIHPPLYPKGCLPMDFAASMKSVTVLGRSQKANLKWKLNHSLQCSLAAPIL